MVRLLYLLIAVTGVLACGERGRDGVDGSAPPHAAAFSAASVAPRILREEAVVRTAAAPERWALVWRRPPRLACGPDEVEMAITCPCAGFAYGEMGELDLVRRRAGRPDERLALTPLFDNGENPAWREHLAVLRRWPMGDSDYAGADSVDLGPIIRARPAARAIALGDYDHDGRATEFLLQVGASPCGHQAAVLVGVSAANRSLHAFASVGHPEEPLVLEPHIWESLLRSGGAAEEIEWECRDHGAETQSEVTPRAGPAGIDGTRSEYECTAGGTRGRLVHSERI